MDSQAGRTATLQHRLGRLAKSSFGPNGRQLRQAAVATARSALWRRLHDLEPEARVLAVADRMSSMRDVWSLLPAARGEMRFLASKSREEDAKSAQELSYWTKQASHRVQELCAHVAGLDTDCFSSLPSEEFRIFKWRADYEACIKGAAHATTLFEFGFTAALEQIWTDRHVTIMHASCKDIPPGPPKPSRCLMLGFCGCANSVNGLNISRFYTRFTNALKQCCPHNTAKSKWLVDSRIVVRL